MKLSILICTLPQRTVFYNRLIAELLKQCNPVCNPVDHEIISDSTTYHTIGKKRNYLLNHAKGEYVAFIDDDDRISHNYISLLMEGISKGVDCCSLVGEITEDGKNPLIFEHSIKYREYRTNPDASARVRYERYPNHLNCIKSSIAKQFKFPEKNHGEDTDWATQIFKSGLIKTEHEIPQIIYYYDYRSQKPELK